jgi:hypothetical protein
VNLTQFGHNETAVRLGMLANDAQLALARVSAGESTAIEGWLAYGAALNEGRALFASNQEFGAWKQGVFSQLGITQPKADDEELAKDVLEIITVFSARLYGSRSKKNRELMDAMKKAADNASGA